MFNETTERMSSGTALVNELAEVAPTDRSLKARARKILLRLIAGGPAFTYYETVRDRLDVIESRSRVSDLIAEGLDRIASADPDFVQRAKGRLLGDMIASQENLEAIALEAHARIEAFADEEQNDSSDTQTAEDWLNAFGREAEIASSDALRDRLAAILVGEIRRPGSFGRSAIRFVGEAEQGTLEAFDTALRFRLGNMIICEAQAWRKGEWFERGRMLESDGLITGSEGFTTRTVSLNDKGDGFLLGESLGLVAQGTPNTHRVISVWMLTRLGRQVASLLPPTDELSSATRLAELMPKEHLRQIVAGCWFEKDDGQYMISGAKVLWESRV